MLCCLFDFLQAHQQLLTIIFVVQAVIGILLVEYSFKSSKRALSAPEEFWNEFPSYRRLDLHKWARWKFYPGAVTVLVPKTILIFTILFTLGIVSKIMYWGESLDRPLTGIRQRIQNFATRCTTRSLSLLFGCWTTYTEHPDEDYSKYLGPNWRETSKSFKSNNVSMMVSNHIGFIEILNYISYCPRIPGFVAGIHVKSFPIGHFYTQIIQSEYVDRNADKESLERQAQYFVDRAKMVEESDREWGPLCFFPEATATNGVNLNRFRRGCFTPLRPINPAMFKNYIN